MQSSAGKATRPRPGALEWAALLLLAFSVAINYIDRGNLSVALSSIEREIHIDQHELGVLSMSFFLSYSLLQIGAAKLIDRFNVLWLYAAGYFLWSVVTALTGAVRDVQVLGFAISNFTTLFLLRVLLGMGESVAYPAISKMIPVSFPESLRGTANAAIDTGTKLGPAIGMTVSSALLGRYGWRGMFIALGLASLIWLLPWYFVASRLPLAHAQQKEEPPSYRQIMGQRAFWGCALGLFGGNYAWYFMLTWLPYYFEHERHAPKERLSLIASLPFWSVSASCMISGPVADLFVRRGFAEIRVRQAASVIGLSTCCLFMFGSIVVRDSGVSMALLMTAAFCFGIFSSNHWALTQGLAGSVTAGKWTGLENCYGNFAGIVAPWLTGFTLNATHSFSAAFVITCVALALGVAGYWFVVGKSTLAEWTPARERISVR